MFLGVKVSSLRLIAIVSGGYMRCTCWEGVKEVSRRCQGGVKPWCTGMNPSAFQ